MRDKTLTDEELRKEVRYTQADVDALNDLATSTTPTRGAFAKLAALKLKAEMGHPKVVKEAQADQVGPVVIIIEDGEVKQRKEIDVTPRAVEMLTGPEDEGK